MRELIMQSLQWRTRDDVYDAFFRAVGAPSWHGRNFDALVDSIETGEINKIEVPYCLVIKDVGVAEPEAAEMIGRFADLIKELRDRGCDVDVRIER
jgi:RNAse (barnase) inhibitor barstar